MLVQLVTLIKQSDNSKCPQKCTEEMCSYSKLNSHFLPSPGVVRLAIQRTACVWSACVGSSPI